MPVEMQQELKAMEKKEDCNNVVIRNALVTESDIPQQKEADIGDISLQLPTKQNNSRLMLIIILCFAFCGNFAVQISRAYPSGFYLEFLKEKNLDKTIGTIAISTQLITMGASPYIITRIPKLMQISLVLRCLVMCFITFICNVLLALVDELVEQDPAGLAAFVVIGVLRAVQGVSSGVLFVIVQGEVVDLYFKGKNLMIVIISSAMHVGSIVGAVVGAEAYIAGGWTLVGPTLAILLVLPVLFLPVFPILKSEQQNAGELTETQNGNCEDKTRTRKVKLSKLQLLVYYIPDIAVFMNNLVFNLLIYVLPVRLVQFSDMSLSSAVLFMNLLNVFSLFSSLLLGYLTNKKFDVFLVMIIGNVVYYTGCIMCFGSTTQFLEFPFSFEVGSALVGFGDASIVNLCIRSKFALYERWGISLEGANLGRHASLTFNVMFSLSAVVGVIVSGMTTTRASEIPTLAGTGATLVAVSLGLVMCKLV